MTIRTNFRTPASIHARKAQSRRGWLFRSGVLITLSAVASTALSGCGRSDARMNTPAPHVVRVVEVGAQRPATNETRHYTGVVRARTESNLGFRVAGKIAERLVNAGETVKSGQPLLKLDPTDYQLALNAARALQKQTALEFERVRVLVEKRAESRDALERAAAAAESSAAQAEQVANQASYTTLFADTDGIVMTTLAEPGQVVAAGQPVIVLAKNGRREAAVDIPEHALVQLRNHAATARLYLNPEVAVPATLREVSGVADPVARTYEARYVLEGEPAQFPLGATVTVRVSSNGEVAEPVTEIPLGSLIDRGDGASVWVVDPHTSTLQKRPVSIAKLGAESALISQGLQHGDLVVSLGAQLLNTGQAVRMVMPAAKDAQ